MRINGVTFGQSFGAAKHLWFSTTRPFGFSERFRYATGAALVMDSLESGGSKFSTESAIP